MAINFTYTESTNIVVQLEGTEGTPATFANFVTADRAGTADLLPAENCTVNHTLTYQIRPVELRALQISFILSGTSAGATDTLDVTGTDWDGQAQNESIDVSGGDATYNGAYKWRTITDMDCTGWADGTLQVTQPQWGVIWDKGSNQYQVDSLFEIGDGGTSTYFQTKSELIKFTIDVPHTKASAYFYIGSSSGDWSGEGSYLVVAPSSANKQLVDGGTVEIYGSIVEFTSNFLSFGRTTGGSIAVKNSIFRSYDASKGMVFYTSLSYISLQDVYGSKTHLGFRKEPDVCENVHMEDCSYGIIVNAQQATVFNIRITNPGSVYPQLGGANYIIMIDNVGWTPAPRVGAADGYIAESFTCNIHMADKEGADLVSASVDCEYAHLVEGTDNKTYKCIQDHTAVDATHLPITGNDWASYWELYSDTESFFKTSWLTGFNYKYATTEFSTQTTDANGDITEQIIQWKKWTTTDEVEEKRLHKFTISKPGYETLGKPNFTVDHAMKKNWSLQPLRARNYARSRVRGVQFQ